MDESLSSSFGKADSLRRQIEDGSAEDSQVTMSMASLTLQTSLQECITLYERCKELVEQLALFSDNESIDDVASSELKCGIGPH